MRYTDAEFTKSDYWDLSIGSDGDISKVNSFDTAILLSLFCERRASPSEVEPPEMRRGWLGNMYLATEYGSKLWMLYQARLTQYAVNRCRTYLNQAFAWITEGGYAKQINVEPVRNVSDGIMTATINIYRNDDEIETLNYTLWENTGA